MNLSTIYPRAAARLLQLSTTGCLLFAVALGTGCSDDGDGNGGDTGDGLAPNAAVAFPPAQSLTDVTTITVRGRADDVDGIAEIRVNGVVATTDNDFADWQATVELVPGDNTVTIASEDIYGNAEAQAAQVTITHAANWLDVPTAVAADPANGRALVLDRVLDALLSIDYGTGERVLLSAEGIGNGPPLRNPVAVALDEDNARAVVLDDEEPTLLAIDLTTGDRTTLSDASTGAGLAFNDPHGLALAGADAMAWVMDVDETDPLNPLPIIVAIDLTTGDRSVVEDPNTGDRPALTQPDAIAVDGPNSMLYIADTDISDPLDPQPAIYALDLTTAALTLLSGDDPVLLDEPTALAFHPDVDSNLLYLLDSGSDSIISVALDTGARAIITRDGTNNGREFSVPNAISVERIDPATTRALVIDTGLDILFGVDIGTGDRSVLSEVAIGAGPALGRPAGLVVDAADGTDGRALVIDQQDEALVAIDMRTGARTVISNEETGSGTPFDNPVALALNVAVGLDGQSSAATRAYVVDEGADAVVEVDLATGARTELSGPGAGSGAPLEAPSAVAFQPGDMEMGTLDRLLVSDENGSVSAIDLATGDRTSLTDADPGNGPVLGTPRALTLELGALGYTGRVLVADENPPALVAVDVLTGMRTAVSGLGTGDGAELDQPTSVVMELQPTPPRELMEGEEPPPRYMASGYALAVHAGASSLLAIELDTGRRTELYSIDDGRGPSLEDPESIALDPRNQRLTLSDAGLDGVLVVDLVTGERVLFSR